MLLDAYRQDESKFDLDCFARKDDIDVLEDSAYIGAINLAIDKGLISNDAILGRFIKIAETEPKEVIPVISKIVKFDRLIPILGDKYKGHNLEIEVLKACRGEDLSEYSTKDSVFSYKRNIVTHDSFYRRIKEINDSEYLGKYLEALVGVKVKLEPVVSNIALKEDAARFIEVIKKSGASFEKVWEVYGLCYPLETLEVYQEDGFGDKKFNFKDLIKDKKSLEIVAIIIALGKGKYEFSREDIESFWSKVISAENESKHTVDFKVYEVLYKQEHYNNFWNKVFQKKILQTHNFEKFFNNIK
jgi:hypothetical protein